MFICVEWYIIIMNKRSYIYEVRNKTKQSNNFKRYLNDLCDNILRSIIIDTSEESFTSTLNPNYV